MRKRQLFGLLVLGLLAATLIYLVRSRGVRLGGSAPAPLSGRFAKEEAWIVDEIVRDIAESAAYPAKAPADLSITASADGLYRVSSTSIAGAPIELDLRQDLWSPAQFASLARATLGSHAATAAHRSVDAVPLYPDLLTLTPAALVNAGASASRALASDMRDERAHEAAALTLATFALRESAGRFADTRWAMNRMTAHLALAHALRAGATPSVDGQLADVVLLMLAGHQTRALEALKSARNAASSNVVDAWARAIRLHLTQDPRILTTPAQASLLEKREYFRAYRATTPSTMGGLQLEQLGVTPAADWYRIIEAFGVGVEDGEVISQVLDAERAESGDVFQRMHGRAIDPGGFRDLNARATRLVGNAGPEVLPWGAWAEFAQRHLAMFVGKSDNHYRHMLGNEHVAGDKKRELGSTLAGMRVFPIASLFWTRGVRGGDADLTLINDAVDTAVAAPELMSPAAWAFLAMGVRYEPVRRGMSPPDVWFMPPSPRIEYEGGVRLQETSSAPTDAILTMLRDAPYDGTLAALFLRLKFGAKPPAADVRRAYGPRLEYDVRALRAARAFAVDAAGERTALARTACDVSAPECIALGGELADEDREQEAAASYERAFADPTLDAIALSNASGWLVTYYYRHGRLAAALALAERSGGTGSLRGLVTEGYLYERLGRSKEAEEAFRSASDAYDEPAQLLGFYYRAVTLRKQMEFEPAWTLALARVFPNGLEPVTTSDAHPAHGVVVTRDSARSRTAGLQAGDIIVGLEGWRVDNMQQYTAINAFFEGDDVKLTAWRGRLSAVAAKTPNRLFGIDFRSYPIQGWREQ